MNTSRVLLAIVFAGVISACSSEPAIDTQDIEIACASTETESATSIVGLSRTELAANAQAARTRADAGKRIAATDNRYAPLSEALIIIANAAQTLTEDPSGEETPINWDLVKLAQAAAADQCSLLTRD